MEQPQGLRPQGSTNLQAPALSSHSPRTIIPLSRLLLAPRFIRTRNPRARAHTHTHTHMLHMLHTHEHIRTSTSTSTHARRKGDACKEDTPGVRAQNCAIPASALAQSPLVQRQRLPQPSVPDTPRARSAPCRLRPLSQFPRGLSAPHTQLLVPLRCRRSAFPVSHRGFRRHCVMVACRFLSLGPCRFLTHGP